MQIYLVGGAVRDELLGRPPGERDWVVVGATPEEMTRRGFKPVGRHFPVFLHPDTKEEYALARTERKTGPGYHGFTFHTGPSVSLEEDLRRRDLTINAIAKSESGKLIDPYGGRRDLENKLLHHVSRAFVEDPVRILRVARFAARLYPDGFRIAAETTALMREMVAAGEIKALVAERVWKECETALAEPAPSRFFLTLKEIGALDAVAPERAPGLADLLQLPQAVNAVAHAIDECARSGNPGKRPHLTFAALAIQTSAYEVSLEPACKFARAPSAYSRLASAAWFCRRRIQQDQSINASVLLDVFERTDAFRNPERLTTLLEAWRFCDFPVAEKKQSLARIRTALDAVNRLDLGRVAAACSGDVGKAVREARLEVLSQEENE